MQMLMTEAAFLSESDLIPAHFRDTPANVYIALQVADRANLDGFGVLQNLYVIHGRPAFQTQLAVALLNASGRTIGPIRFAWDRATKTMKASVIDAATRDSVSHELTWDTVKANGWLDKRDSHWKKDAQLMMKYRTALQLIRTTYPEVLLGMSTVEEVREMADADPLTVDTVAFYADRKLPQAEPPGEMVDHDFGFDVGEVDQGELPVTEDPLAADLARCVNLGQVTVTREAYMEQHKFDETMLFEVTKACDARESEIRASRTDVVR